MAARLDGVRRSFVRRAMRALRGVVPSIAPLLAGLAGAVVASGLAPPEGSRDLYATAAQVIPVLLLALAFEARAFSIDGPVPAGPDYSEPLEELARIRETLVTAREADASHRARLAKLEADATDLLRQADEALPSASGDEREKFQAARSGLLAKLAEATTGRDENLELIRELEGRVARNEAVVDRDRRSWRLVAKGWRLTRGMQAGLGTAMLAAGEFQALLALANGDVDARPWLAFGAVGYGFGAVLVLALVRPAPSQTRGSQPG